MLKHFMRDIGFVNTINTVDSVADVATFVATESTAVVAVAAVTFVHCERYKNHPSLIVRRLISFAGFFVYPVFFVRA